MGARRMKITPSVTWSKPLLLTSLALCLAIPWAAHAKQCTNSGGAAIFQSYPMQKFMRKYDEDSLESVVHHKLADSLVNEPLKQVLRGRQLVEGQPPLEEFSLTKVRLLPGSHHASAQETNLRYLMMLDNDRLAWSFRVQAGIKPLGEPLGGWEHPQCELRGHFVGHYLSATALMWASTGDEALRIKMSALVDILADCQDRIGTGYLSAFPPELFDRFEAIQPVWAPYYTIHKIMAGMLSQYTAAGNAKALRVVTRMADYFRGRVARVIEAFSIERHWEALNEEVGGMNDVLYELYTITKDPGHLWLAHLFDKPCFLGPLALETDWLAGLHSNTHIPIVIGAQKRFEVTGDPLYKQIAENFFSIVNGSHMYSTGGTSAGEFWQNPKRMGDTLHQEDEESCCTYNMLKVARNLFRWGRSARHADYLERALSNDVLGIQRGAEPGKMIYMLPLGAGNSKARGYHGWGDAYDSFWCCYGTGVESFSKLGDSLYFREPATGGLYVVQFVPSTLEWESAGLRVLQGVEGPSAAAPDLHVTLQFSPLAEVPGDALLLPSAGASRDSAAKALPVFVRVPWWADAGKSSASLNGKLLEVPAAGSFLQVTHEWKAGDQLKIILRVRVTTEPIEDDRPGFQSLHALLFGPHLLAGLTHADRTLSARRPEDIPSALRPVPADANGRTITLLQRPAAQRAPPPSTCSKPQYLQSARGAAAIARRLSARIATRGAPDPTDGHSWRDFFPFLDPVAKKENPWVDETSSDLVLRAVAGRVVLGPRPVEGSDEAIEGTFLAAQPLADPRHIPVAPSRTGEEPLLSLELFALPGQFVAHNGSDQLVVVVRRADVEAGRLPRQSHPRAASVLAMQERGTFRVVPGLSDPKSGLSFEAVDLPGHFLTTFCAPSVPSHGTALMLRKRPLHLPRPRPRQRHLDAHGGADGDAEALDSSDSSEDNFSADEVASFDASSTFERSGKALAAFPPASFVATGVARDFLLVPISGLLDESYTGYFSLATN